jgi:hypothetical protein
LRLPRLRLRITRSTSFEALREYFRAMIHPFLIRASLETFPLLVGANEPTGNNRRARLLVPTCEHIHCRAA